MWDNVSEMHVAEHGMHAVHLTAAAAHTQQTLAHPDHRQACNPCIQGLYMEMKGEDIANSVRSGHQSQAMLHANRRGKS